MLAFYDCSASREAADSKLSTVKEAQSINDDVQFARDHDIDSADDQDQTTGTATLYRTATAGIRAESSIFPSRIPPADSDADTPTIATDPTFLEYFRRVQHTREIVVIGKEEIRPFLRHLEKTKLGDDITCLVLLPITSSDDKLRAVAIACLNPRIRYNDAYARFLDLFKAQVANGMTSIRFIQEEIRRSEFYAALIKSKNEELHRSLEERTQELRNSGNAYK